MGIFSDSASGVAGTFRLTVDSTGSGFIAELSVLDDLGAATYTADAYPPGLSGQGSDWYFSGPGCATTSCPGTGEFTGYLGGSAGPTGGVGGVDGGFDFTQ